MAPSPAANSGPGPSGPRDGFRYDCRGLGALLAMSTTIQDIERRQLREVPRFKAGDISGGIKRGVEDIIQVLSGDAQEWQDRAAQKVSTDNAQPPPDGAVWPRPTRDSAASRSSINRTADS